MSLTAHHHLRSCTPGYEAVLTAIENHGEGSFCVAFQTPLRAVEWASDVQNALLKAAWPEVRPNSCISHHTHTHTPQGALGLIWRHQELLGCPAAAEEWGNVHDRLLFRGPRVRMGFHFGRPKAAREPVYKSVQYAGTLLSPHSTPKPTHTLAAHVINTLQARWSSARLDWQLRRRAAKCWSLGHCVRTSSRQTSTWTRRSLSAFSRPG
jgi:hypothetical protein